MSSKQRLRVEEKIRIVREIKSGESKMIHFSIFRLPPYFYSSQNTITVLGKLLFSKLNEFEVLEVHLYSQYVF